MRFQDDTAVEIAQDEPPQTSVPETNPVSEIKESDTVEPEQKIDAQNIKEHVRQELDKLVEFAQNSNVGELRKQYVNKVLENFDYDNAAEHLRHFNMIVKKGSLDVSKIQFAIENGYFSSKEGADAFNILRSKKIAIIGPQDRTTMELDNILDIIATCTPEQVIKLDKYKVFDKQFSDKECILRIRKYSEEELAKLVESDLYKNFECLYVSDNENINQLFEFLARNKVPSDLYKLMIQDPEHLKSLEKMIKTQAANNPDSIAEICIALTLMRNPELLMFALSDNNNCDLFFVANHASEISDILGDKIYMLPKVLKEGNEENIHLLGPLMNLVNTKKADVSIIIEVLKYAKTPEQVQEIIREIIKVGVGLASVASLKNYIREHSPKEEKTSTAPPIIIKPHAKDVTSTPLNPQTTENIISMFTSGRPDFNEMLDKLEIPKTSPLISLGSIEYIDENLAHHQIYYNKYGKIVGYKCTYKDKKEFIIYNKSGEPRTLSKEAWENFIDKNIVGTETFEALLRTDNPYIDKDVILNNDCRHIVRFTKVDIQRFSEIVKNEDDAKVLNALVSAQKSERYEYDTDNIIKILQSQKARSYVLDRVNAGLEFNKDVIKILDESVFFKPKTFDRTSQRNLTYEIQDITLNDENGSPIAAELIDEAIKNNKEYANIVPSGEVANINGKLYVNNDGHFEQLNLTKEKFMELFPQKTRHMIKQGVRLGDCWLVTAFGALMDSPKGRVAIFKMFSQDGDKISVTFPDADIPITFRKGTSQDLSPVSAWWNDGIKISIGSSITACDGLKILEQAYAIHRYDGYKDANIPQKDIEDIFFLNRQMKYLGGGYTGDAIENIVGKENIAITRIYDKQDYIKFLEEYANNPNVIVTFGTLNYMLYEPELDLDHKHAYHIVGYDKENGLITISNPHHNNKITQIPVLTWMKYVDNFEISEFL